MKLGVENEQIQNQINQLFSSILLEQQKFDKLKEPDTDKKDLLKSKLEEYSKSRGREFFYNYISTGRGHGPFTELLDGSVKYDLIEGIGFNLLGHSHPIMIKSCLEAATIDTIMCGNLQTYEAPNELTKALISSVSKSRLKHFWFTCSGSFANDLALKLLWQKQAPKYNLIAFKKAFAGRSIATQDITDKPEFREGMPQSINVKHVPHYDQNDPDNSLKITLEALDKTWNEAPNSFCAIMIELIQGEGGFVFGPKKFYEMIFQWAKDKGIYIWMDEVQTFGRTHELFSFQMFGLDEYVDILTIGKALHCCGVLYTEELNPRPGLIAGTFNSSIPAIICGQKVLSYLQGGNFYGPKGRNLELEKIFLSNLNKLKEGSCAGKIGYCGGVGTMISFEVGNSSNEIANKFVKKLFDNGVIAFTAGKNPTRIRFLLPLSLTEDHIEEIFSIIERTVHEVI